MLKTTVVVGNPKPNSRTRSVALTMIEKLLVPETYDLTIIDLAEHVDELFSWPSTRMEALTEAVMRSDLVVFASPTYKASYTGLLKAFLDRFQSRALSGKAAIAIHTGGTLSHAMSPEVSLVPLLTELGAVVPGRGFYFPVDQFDHLDDIVGLAAKDYAANLRVLANLSSFAAPQTSPDA